MAINDNPVAVIASLAKQSGFSAAAGPGLLRRARNEAKPVNGGGEPAP